MPSEVGQQNGYLVSRQADFWLLGGASIGFWAACHLLEFLNPHYTTANQLINHVPALFAMFSVAVNAPHFMASYHLAYTRGLPFVLENWFQLIAVPLMLAVALVLGDLMFGMSVETWSAFGRWLNGLLEPLGIFLVVGVFQSFGEEVVHQLITIMYLTVGWHYVKQVFGCFMVYSRFDGYELNGEERNLIKASLLSIWGFNFFSDNISLNQVDFFTAKAITNVFPVSVYQFFELFTVFLFLLVGYRIFYRRYRDRGELPPAAAVVAWVAIFIWWMPFARSLTFFIFAVPFFHGLQYLPFYKKIIDARYNDPAVSARSFSFYFSFLVLAGFLAFYIGPETVDLIRGSESRLQMTYWMAGIALFINIHHFFIDNTLWRFKDRNVQRWLFSRT
jgi:hypothetical protein